MANNRRVREDGYVMLPGHVYEHRAVANAPADMQVDHIDGNRSNNDPANLRLCTHAQNLWNAGKKKHNTSGFKGVYFCKQTKKWRAEIRANRKCYKLGRFETPERAARAYDSAARILHGGFAKLNFESETKC